MVNESPSASEGAPIVKVLSVSSVKVREPPLKVGAEFVFVGMILPPPPPPPPPQEAKANAARLAKSIEPLPLS